MTYDTPLFGKIFTTPARLSKDEAMYQIAQAVLKICSIVCQKFRGHVTPATPLLGKYNASGRHSILRSYKPNLMSLPQTVLKIFCIICQKIYGSRDLSHAPFRENYLCARSAFPRRSNVLNLQSLAQVVSRYFRSYAKKFRGHVT